MMASCDDDEDLLLRVEQAALLMAELFESLAPHHIDNITSSRESIHHVSSQIEYLEEDDEK